MEASVKVFGVVHSESLYNFLWCLASELDKELFEKVAEQLRKEPVLAYKEATIGLHHGTLIHHLGNEVSHWPLDSSILLSVQVIDIDLLIDAFQVNRLSLHCNLIALFRVSLN